MWAWLKQQIIIFSRLVDRLPFEAMSADPCDDANHSHHVSAPLSVYQTCSFHPSINLSSLCCGGKEEKWMSVLCVTALHTLPLLWTSHHLISTAGYIAQPCMARCGLHYSGERHIEVQQFTDCRLYFQVKREESIERPVFKFLQYFARRLLMGRSVLEKPGLHLMRRTGVSSCSAHPFESTRVYVWQQQKHSHTNMHTVDKIG